MVLTSFMLLPIADIKAHSAISGMLDARCADSVYPDGEGWHDVASAAWLDVPGRCLMVKRQRSVRCLRRNSLELVISSRVRSPNIFTRGLWSVTTSSLSQP